MIQTDSVNNFLIETVSTHNILPLGSMCNLNCVFCSNLQNPKDLQAVSLPHLTLDDVQELLDFIDPTSKIIIGESATRINEGEPFANPQIEAILPEIRNRFPKTLLQITTNGSLLTKSLVNFLRDLEPVELNISVNSLTANQRSLLMGKQAAHNFEKVLEYLSENEMDFSGSAVWVPDIVSKHSIADMAEKLEYHQAQTFRVFLPGYTKWTNYQGLNICEQEEQVMRQFVTELNCSLKIPVLMEPPKIENLNCIVEGILPKGPAHSYGLQTGDQISSVDSEIVKSRVQGFLSLKSRENPYITVIRDNKTFSGFLTKSQGEPPGIAVSYDVSPNLIEDLGQKIAEIQNFPGNILIFTSELGYRPIKLVLDRLFSQRWGFSEKAHEKVVNVIPVESTFFGGNIRCSGLLTVADFRNKLNYLINNMGDEYLTGTLNTINDNTVVLLPPNAFDNGKDLRGEHVNVLQDEFSVSVMI